MAEKAARAVPHNTERKRTRQQGRGDDDDGMKRERRGWAVADAYDDGDSEWTCSSRSFFCSHH